ncbi:MAG: hypothetical protein R3B48_24500 [Kofleriaceae bacterium]
MADDSADQDDERRDAGGFAEVELRAALYSLRDPYEASLDDVLRLAAAAPTFAVPLLPQGAIDAVHAKRAIDRDLANGGLDQVAWNHGAEATRRYAAAFDAIGAIENAEVLARLADAVERYRAEHGDAIEQDPVHHFLAFRAAQGGPYFAIPSPAEELAEPLVEYVLARVEALPDPEGELPRRGS